METTPIVLASGPQDVIAAVWYQLGYRPRDSVVLVAVHGPRHRLGVLARYDLPAFSVLPEGTASPGPAQQSAELSAVAEVRSATGQAAQLLAREGAARVTVLIFQESQQPSRQARVLSAILHGVCTSRLQVLDVLAVGEQSFRSLLCADARCCPPQGHPIDAVHSSSVAVAHVVQGRALMDADTDLLADVRVGGAGAAAAEGSGGDDAADTGQQLPGNRAQPSAITLGERRRWWRQWRQVLAEGAWPQSPPPEFVAALSDPALRDAVLVTLVGGAVDLAAQLLSPEAVTVEPMLTHVLQARPEMPQLLRVRALLAQAVRAAPPDAARAGLAVLALQAWYAGEGVRARLLLEHAARSSQAPSMSLERLVADLLSAGVAPPWTRSE